jgi:dienelactone hydrolase
MSLSRARVVTIVGVITLLFGASRVSVSHEGPSTYVRGVDSDRQRPIDLVANNRAVKVALRDRSIVLHIYLPKQMSADAPLVLYSSGSGGWHQFDGYVASALAMREMPVCGISTHTYLKSFYSTSHPATVPDVISDYSHIIKEARKVAGLDSTRPIILSGWSLGAGYAPLIAADPQIKASVRGVISIAIARDNEKALSVGNRLLSRLTGRTFGPSFDVTEYLTRAFPLPVALIQPAEDQPDSSKSATRLIAATGDKAGTTLRLFEVRSSRNHSFAGGRTEFDHALDEALAWINERSRQSRVARRDGSL